MAEEQAGAARPATEHSRDADRPVSYESLQDLLRAERRSNKLMPLAPRFWPQVREFLQAVTDAFRLEQARDPFGRKVMRLTDEAKNARHATQAIWALRERKLAMLALAAPKERRTPEGITPDEAQLYRAILASLDDSRSRVFDGLMPESSSIPAAPAAPLQLPIQDALPSAPAATPPPAPTDPSALPSPASDSIPWPNVAAQTSSVPQQNSPSALHEPPRPPALAAPPVDAATARPAVTVIPSDTPAAETVTIRALGDIPPFVGPDMQTYLLREGDIATVPPSIANLLVRRQKAAIVEA